MSKSYVCGRCHDQVEQLFPPNCEERPQTQGGGMYHCPDCGAMVVAGFMHPQLCKPCLDRKHPAFDAP